MYLYRQLPTKTVKLKENNFQQEAYIEGFLIENIHLLAQGEDSEVKLIGRQIVLEESGRIDLLVLVLEDRKPKLKIVEIKKVPAGEKEMEQLEKYLKAWKNEGLSLIKEREPLNTFKNTMKGWGKDIKDLEVEGVLVAPKFSEVVTTKIPKCKNIYGIRMSRYSSDDSKETFIFLEYYPESKSGPIPFSAEEFWRDQSIKKKELVEKIIRSVKEREPEITYKYWKSMVSIYPTAEAAESHRRIARYIRGDKIFRLQFTEGKGAQQIDISDKKKIIEGILKLKKQYHQM